MYNSYLLFFVVKCIHKLDVDSSTLFEEQNGGNVHEAHQT